MLDKKYLSLLGLVIAMSVSATPNTAETFFKENSHNLGIITTHSGLQYQIIEFGLGGTPNEKHKIHISYSVHKLDNFTIIENAEKQVNLSELNSVMVEAIKTMKKTGKSRFFIPADKVSNFEKLDKRIPENTPLIVDVHLHNFEI